MRAGLLDTKVVIQHKVLGRDPATGAQTWTWATFQTRWAQVVESADTWMGGEAIESVALVYTRPIRVTMRWLDGVTTAMRLLLPDGRLLEIVGLAMGGRKERLHLSARELSSENVAP